MMTLQTMNEFVTNQIRVWGYDYIENLFDRGYEPAFITDNTGNSKWVWLQNARVAVKHN